MSFIRQVCRRPNRPHLKTEPLLVGAEASEVLHRLGHHVGAQEDDDAAHGRLADLDVEVHLRVLASDSRGGVCIA